MDTTFRGWSSTLAARVRLVLSRLIWILLSSWISMVGSVWSGLCIFLLLCMVLRLLSLLLTVCAGFGHLSVGLYGLVVSLWLVLVLSLAFWMGLLGVILLFVLSGFVFVYFVGIWLYGLWKLVEFIVCLRWWVWVCLGHGPVHLLSATAAEIGFRWGSVALAWS